MAPSTKPREQYIEANGFNFHFLEWGDPREKNAIIFLNRYLEMEPNAEDVDFILELIKEIRNKINQ